MITSTLLALAALGLASKFGPEATRRQAEEKREKLLDMMAGVMYEVAKRLDRVVGHKEREWQ